MARILGEFSEVKGVAHCFSSDIDGKKVFRAWVLYLFFRELNV